MNENFFPFESNFSLYFPPSLRKKNSIFLAEQTADGLNFYDANRIKWENIFSNRDAIFFTVVKRHFNKIALIPLHHVFSFIESSFYENIIWNMQEKFKWLLFPTMLSCMNNFSNSSALLLASISADSCSKVFFSFIVVTAMKMKAAQKGEMNLFSANFCCAEIY